LIVPKGRRQRARLRIGNWGRIIPRNIPKKAKATPGRSSSPMQTISRSVMQTARSGSRPPSAPPRTSAMAIRSSLTSAKENPRRSEG
jgi:hypothetical protein